MGTFSVSLHQGFVRAKLLRFVDGPVPGVKPHVNFLIERQRSEMAVAATHVIHGGGQGQVLIVRAFHCAQKRAKIWKVAYLEGEEVFRFMIYNWHFCREERQGWEEKSG